jgi:hypothetical protein
MNHVFKWIATACVALVLGYCLSVLPFVALFGALNAAYSAERPYVPGSMRVCDFVLILTVSAGFLSLILGQQAQADRLVAAIEKASAAPQAIVPVEPMAVAVARSSVAPPPVAHKPAPTPRPRTAKPVADADSDEARYLANRETEKLRRRMSGGG